MEENEMTNKEVCTRLVQSMAQVAAMGEMTQSLVADTINTLACAYMKVQAAEQEGAA